MVLRVVHPCCDARSPFFFRCNYVEAVRSSPRLPFFTFDRIHRTKPGGNRSRLAEKSINFRSKRRKKKSRNIYVEQIVFSIRRTEASLSRFTVVSWRTSVAIDVAPMISISRWFPSAHMRLRLAIKDTPIKEINTREIARAAEV